MPPSGREVPTNIADSRIGQYLEASPLTPTPSEAHGLLCGLVCGGDPDPVNAWIDQLLPPTDASDPLTTESRKALGDFGTAIENQIQNPDLGIEIQIPGDTSPLAERAEALYDWVRGFLFALGILGLSERNLSEQGREILDDLAAMTRMDLDDLDETEENEQALTEITEFIRVAAMLIHDERASARDEARSS
ncbi:UPF0149 family protein [Thiocystis violacea]|uniref:UPF0149 family protein n=1 Tax=Thiocystis violacea TaxID=13725 RepID=UPI001905946F|nr:YecA family protein [Thiocystis violacea]MBK1716504.1 hypothetical protein [Thiocystis violacea]